MENFPFHGLDVAIVVILVWSAMVGFIRGIVREVAAILAWVVAIIGSILLFPVARPWIEKYVNIPVLTDVITYGGAFLILLLVSRLLLRSLRAQAADAQVSGLDRGLGFVFGLARAAFVLCLVLLITDSVMTKEDQPTWLTKFQSRPLLEKGGRTLKAAVPDDMWEQVKKDIAALQKLTDEKKDHEDAGNTEDSTKGAEDSNDEGTAVPDEKNASPLPEDPVEESTPESSTGEVGL